MALLSNVSKDTLSEIARYMDKEMNGEEVWRLFIHNMVEKIYTYTEIETFAEENLNTRGSPSRKLLNNLMARDMSLSEFLDVMKKIKCTKVLNLFLQRTTPVIQRESQTDILVSPGGTLTLYCIADCKPPPPSYQWYFNNDPMPYQTNCTLTVTNCHQGSHNGFYHCCVTNTAIDNKRQSTVRSRGTNVEITSVPIQESGADTTFLTDSTLSYDDNDPRMRSESSTSITPRGATASNPDGDDIRITVHPGDVTCRYNEEVVLQCTAISMSGTPLDCQWMIGRQPQANNASRSNNTFYFKKKFSRGSIMEIYCVISSNGNRVVSDKAKVNVQSVWIERQPCSYHGYIGQIAILECEASGKGPIEYQWFKEDNGKKTPVQPSSNSGMLEFPCLNGKDWGTYVCQALNVEGSVSSKSVEVRCEPYREKAFIAVQPRSHVCLEGSSITLRCEAVSTHEIHYEWYHNNKLIESECQDILILSPMGKDLFGEYHCVVKSPPDTVKSDTAVVLEGTPFESTESYNQTQTGQHEAEYTFQTADGVLYAREKVAFLIGNQRYTDMKSLNSPHSDISFLSKSLKALDFKVFTFCDLTYREIMQTLDVFCKLLDSGVYCVFYYSGHGFNYQHVDYIMPVDIMDPIKCDYCIPVEYITYRLQTTKAKVLMLLDCCRVNYGDNVEGPAQTSVNDCGYSNVYKIWSCSVSKPAYERTSEQCSVFNVALRGALEEGAESVNDFYPKIQEYMQKKGLAKDGKEFQRPVVLQKLAPHKLSLHDRVMFDEKTTSLVQGIKEFTHRVHGLSSVKILERDLNGIANGEVMYTFPMTNVLHVHVKLTKKVAIKDCTVTLNSLLTSNCFNKDTLSRKLKEGKLCIEFEGDIHLWEADKDIPSWVICINISSVNGSSVQFKPVIKAVTFWSHAHTLM